MLMGRIAHSISMAAVRGHRRARAFTTAVAAYLRPTLGPELSENILPLQIARSTPILAGCCSHRSFSAAPWVGSQGPSTVDIATG